MKVNRMDRLTQTTPIDTFKRCQICGYTSDEIVGFRFWRECDDNDKPEPYSILITCKSSECDLIIDQHPRLYIELTWGTGLPGHLSLLCGDCTHREGARCTHPDLGANGGEGLMLVIDKSLAFMVCYHDENNEMGGLRCQPHKGPFMKCAGLPEDHLRHFEKEASIPSTKYGRKVSL